MKRAIAILSALMMTFSLAACNSTTNEGSASDAATETASEVATEEASDEASEEASEETSEEASEEATAEAATEVTITHSLGETTVPVNPETIVVGDYGILDMLNSVGIEANMLPKSSLPEYLSKFQSDDYIDIGTVKEVDFELINENAPDFIAITGRLSSSYETLSEIAPTVYFQTNGADYLSDMKFNIDVLAQIYPDKAGQLYAEYDSIVNDAAALKEKAEASGLTSLIVMTNDNSLSFFGADSRYGVIHTDFGFTPVSDDIEASTHGSEGSFEYFTEVNPDVLFVVDRSAAVGTDGATGAATLLDNDLVNATNAAQNGKIVYLSSDIWYVVSGGIESTKQMIDEVTAALK